MAHNSVVFVFSLCSAINCGLILFYEKVRFWEGAAGAGCAAGTFWLQLFECLLIKHSGRIEGAQPVCFQRGELTIKSSPL